MPYGGCPVNPELRGATASYPRIEPVPCGAKRPFWSVMIPVYNCADYLGDTLASVLPQFDADDAVQIHTRSVQRRRQAERDSRGDREHRGESEHLPIHGDAVQT